MSTDTCEIVIKNCNNIDESSISIAKGKLNIKYGSNGTGKSTIANAILSQVKNDNSLASLLPFKLREENPNNLEPEVTGAEELASAHIFNDEYVSNFVFKPDEVVQSSFDIFIRTPAYEEKIRAIEEIVGNIKNAFREDEDLDQLIIDLGALSDSFKLTKTGLSKASTGYKAIAKGNKLENIPDELSAYSAFLKGDSNVQWIDWQQKGQQFTEISEDCPFCATSTKETKERIVRVSKEYDKNVIKNLSALIGVLERLGDYFSDATKDQLLGITTLKAEPDEDHLKFLASTKEQVDILLKKFSRLKQMSWEDFPEAEKVSDKLPKFKIELTYLERLDSPKTAGAVEVLNKKLDDLIDQAGRLQGQINQQRKEVQRLIQENQDSINGFLSNAGYKYEVFISTEEKEDYKLKLRHIDYSGEISGGGQHLSFGEKNAFSLILFMHECLSKNPGLVILDDPISSFDKNKKYAILDRLFRKDNSFKGMTTLMLTHDIEPIIDSTKVLHSQFSGISRAHFLRFKNGFVSEKIIKSQDMKTFAQICKHVLSSGENMLIKAIYLRRYFEIVDDKEDAYQVLSNLFKGREREEMIDFRLNRDSNGDAAAMEENDINNGLYRIRDELGESLDYTNLVRKATDASYLIEAYREAKSGYEKLQLYRLIDAGHKNTVIRKYINESYHIENDYICQLDPREFDFIPEYVIKECDNAIADMEQSS